MPRDSRLSTHEPGDALSENAIAPLTRKPDRQARICLAGCSPMTGNLGVSALCYATMRALYAEIPAVTLSVLDDGWGARRGTLTLDGRAVDFCRVGERLSRRYWRHESLWNIRVSSRLGGLRNPTARMLRRAAAVFDISGGDSFTDMYGPRRFRAVTLFKQIVLENRIPLILLPQTYGPFANAKNRRVAESIVRRSAVAWARDRRSFETLKELASRDFDPQLHRCGVDVAFGLEALEPEERLLQVRLRDWLGDRTRPIVGINVSGLIYNDHLAAARQYGLKADYRQVIQGFVKRLLDESDSNIVLVPHVITRPGHFESDLEACADVAEACANSPRVLVLPAFEDPRQVKWVIAQLDWFCGTRMHATIAALSSGVPTAAIAYSIKTLGVFESVGAGSAVVDPRDLATAEAVSKLWQEWEYREPRKIQLRVELRDLQSKLTMQNAAIAAICHSRSKARSY